MSFNILYVEDILKHFRKLEKAVNEYNSKEQRSSEDIVLTWAQNLNELKNNLNYRIDIVLADMYLEPGPGDKGNRLRDVIAIVKEWCERNGVGRPIPIIAYTIGGEDAFKYRKDLYDIWDKNTASADYVTWRFSELSKELARIHPDALMLRLIRTNIPQSPRVSWHSHVIDMIERYGKGWTEADQIERVGRAIANIANQLDSWEDISSMWDIVKDWEFLGRAVSVRARGHARHAINVFWLGYYLIHHEKLRDYFTKQWKRLRAQRSYMSPVENMDFFEAINNIWFYTGLFHDMGGCMEKFAAINRFRDKLYSPFNKLALNLTELPYFSVEGIEEKAGEFLHDFKDPLKSQLKKAWAESIADQKIDHGMIAALTLNESISNEKQNCFAREAGRAIAIHNLVGRFEQGRVPNLTWKEEPFACLLLLCDQLQTWDRERGDTKLSTYDGPERAELEDLEITDKELQTENGPPKELPHIRIAIDYIAPPHLKHAPELYQRVKDDLDFILRHKPRRAINKIAGPWPFFLDVNFFLSKDPLNAFIKITPETGEFI